MATIVIPDPNCDLSVSIINCNSLNMSDVSRRLQIRKLYSVCKLRTDIILLSDIRLSNKAKVSSVDDVSRVFHLNPYRSYKFMHNSSQNKRGVGILIANSLNFIVSEFYRDNNENILALLLNNPSTNEELVVGAV